MKGKNKLVKRIKKQALKSFEKDMQGSVLKELYKNKSEVDEIREQVLSELKEEIFGAAEESIIEEKGKSLKDELRRLMEEGKETESKEDSDGEVDVESKGDDGKYIYKGFKFDVEKMKSLANGGSITSASPGVERVGENGDEINKENLKESMKDFISSPSSPFKISEASETDLNRLSKLRDIKEGKEKELIEKSLNKDMRTSSGGFDRISVDSFIKTGTDSFKKTSSEVHRLLTPSKKEDLEFFIGKLKDGISKMSEGERVIAYRHGKDDVYNFNFNKPLKDSVLFPGGSKTPTGDEFALEFNVDLDVKTGAASINKFEFNIDRFRFDHTFFELLDIVKVLDLVGMNLSHYIETINGVNSTGKKPEKKDKAPDTKTKKNRKKSISPNTKVENFIDNKRIVSALHKNDIANYSQLKKFLKENDPTSLKGVGSKSAKQIQEYIK